MTALQHNEIAFQISKLLFTQVFKTLIHTLMWDLNLKKMNEVEADFSRTSFKKYQMAKRLFHQKLPCNDKQLKHFLVTFSVFSSD